MYAIGIYEALSDGGAVLKHILSFTTLDYNEADRKVGVINTQLGHKMDRHGTFTPGTGEIYAMFDESIDLMPSMVGMRIM